MRESNDRTTSLLKSATLLVVWGLSIGLSCAAIVFAFAFHQSNRPHRMLEELLSAEFIGLYAACVGASLFCGLAIARQAGVVQLAMAGMISPVAMGLMPRAGGSGVLSLLACMGVMCLLGAIVNVFGGAASTHARWVLALGIVGALEVFLTFSNGAQSLSIAACVSFILALVVALAGVPPRNWSRLKP